MANKIYPKYKQEVLKHTSGTELNSAEGATGVFAALIDLGAYAYDDAHQFYSDLSGVVGTDQEILSKTQALGTFDGDNVTFPAVAGNTVEALVLYRKNAGPNTTWPLIIYEDTDVAGLPATPTGANIDITWNPSGIFTI